MPPAGTSTNDAEPLISVNNLTKHFPVQKGLLLRKDLGMVHAVDNVTLDVPKNASYGLVGESGCGKTTLGRLLLRVEIPTSGNVYFRGKDIFRLNASESREYRQAVQTVFQDPFSSLSPRMQIWETVIEPLLVNTNFSRKDLKQKAADLLKRVGLPPERLNSYPHLFSGGQRQRIAIARALSSSPEFLVLDEPVSALDVSIRAQIMNLLKELQSEFGLTMVTISHDLAGLRYMSDMTAVMYLGQIVERGPADQVYNNPLHPYTKVLLSSVPVAFAEDRARREEIAVSGEVPSPLNPPTGCRFNPRCPFAMPICSQETPEPKEVEPGQVVSCHLY